MNEALTKARQSLRGLSKERTDLLRLLREDKAKRALSIKPHARLPGVRVPTSWGQQRLWFIDQLEGGAAGYQVPIALRLRGELDAHLLQQALDALIERHEILRTVFVSEGGEPMQEILPQARFALQMVDLCGYPLSEREAHVRRHKVEEVQGKFDLRYGPLIRGRMLRVGAVEHVLLITMHHIVVDGWSKGVLIREITELYTGYQRGCSHPMEPLPIQYSDFTQWQRQHWRDQKILQKQLSHWHTCLAGAAPQMELPPDRPRPAVQTYRGENAAVVLDEQLTSRLRSFAASHDMTLFMVLYAGLAILLSRLSGQEDVVIGTPIANRQRPELERLIGLFVNALALRVKAQPDLPVEAFLQQVKEVTLGGYDHQDVPLEKVVEALQPERSLSRGPLFQVAFVLHNWPKSEMCLPGLTVTVDDEVDEPAILDFWLALEERGAEVVGSVNYASDLFDRQTIQRWMECFKVLLRAITRNIPCRIGELPMLPESERRQVVELFNAPQARYPEKLIQELFEQQVSRTPDAVAVTYERQSQTYAELNRRANQLARLLREKGVGPDRLVGICMDRGLSMVVGLLGILKAGGAYVPLDPTYPPERLAYVLRDAAPTIVLIEDSIREKLPSTASELIAVDGDWSEITKRSADNLEANALRLRPDHLAYVIYTSGSTGQPKGVMVEHRNVTRLFAATEHWFTFNKQDVWSLFHSFAFDFSVWELWGALLYGGRVVVVPHVIARSPRELYQLLCAERVTVLNQTPSAFAQLIDAQMQSREQHALRVVIFGGEALEPRMLRPWVERNGVHRPRLVNMYGITETTVHVTYRELSVADIEFGQGSPIGKTIPDLQVYLLNSCSQPVPIGVIGEVYVGGAGVTRGYLNRPELTRERFLPDRFSTDSQTRLYKTGDLGRWCLDGTIEYLGRNDHQVKIRGFRIELGEIEAQLTSNTRVKDAVVIAREDVPGERRLVAYVISRDLPMAEAASAAEALRAHLKEVLPDYMVPSAFVLLDRFPLTSNGKLDRLRLPAPDSSAHAIREFEAPRGEVEEVLAGIWQALLRLDRVGRQDNFFELGGHSLLIVQMMERLRLSGLTVEMRRVFESATLADLARGLMDLGSGHVAVPPNLIPPEATAITPQMLPLVRLEPQHIQQIAQEVPGGLANIKDIYPLTPVQEGLLFHHLLDEGAGDTYVVPTVLSVSSRDRLNQLIVALQSVIDRHDILRTAVLWDRLPQAVQVVYARANLTVESISVPSKFDAAVLIEDWMKPERQWLDLRRAPMMRLQAMHDARESRWYVLLQIHHIADDATSLRILISEVVAHLQGRAKDLPEPVPYREHVAQVLAPARTQAADAFFRTKLHDIDETTAPFGLVDVRTDGSQVDEVSQEMEPALATSLRALARRLGVSAATLFHAAWGLVVAHASWRQDVVFGTVLLGRLQGSAGGRRTLGMFVNTLPLRLRIQNQTAKELVEQTQRELVELLSHEQASLATAQRCSSIVGSAPLFTAVLNYRHSRLDSDTKWASAEGIQVIASQERTNYPITISVDDMDGGFTLTAQTDRRINPRRITAYLERAAKSLVEALEQSPQTPALSLPILPDSERSRVVETFNSTQADYPHGKAIHELFEEQARHRPNAVAVIDEGQELTYGALNARANQLARFLRDQGVQIADYVPIVMPRCLQMLIAQLAVLKCGAAYVPIDPALPEQRQTFMIRDCGAARILAEQSKLETYADTPVQWLDCTEITGFARMLSPDNLNLELSPGGAAYVMYTSGSTGVPKGVLVPHRAVVRLAINNGYAHIEPTDCIAHCSNPAFDASTFEVWGALLNGARLSIVPYSIAIEASRLAEQLSQHAVTILFLTVGLFKQHSEALASVFSQLRYLITGGDVVEPGAAKLVLRNCAPQHLLNAYGPTEGTTFSSTYTIRSSDDENRSLPIGRPISNTQIYILNGQLQPAPIGATGEIYIGGSGVALGYLNRPELTAERFLKDPFSQDPQARLYKSGDLGRWRADGNIEFLGRYDQQVKLRGFRVELEEIEACLLQHAEVKNAAVVAREDEPGDKRLVAYVIARAPESSNDSEPGPRRDLIGRLREYLKTRLPEYMQPGAWTELEQLPLTPNGKLDRRALPRPLERPEDVGEYASPRTEVERALAETWANLLQVDRVGLHDNFFELGGHSLHAIKLIARVHEHLAVGLPIAAVFQYPTVKQMAEVLESLRLAKRGLLIGDAAEAQMEFEEGTLIGSLVPPDSAR